MGNLEDFSPDKSEFNPVEALIIINLSFCPTRTRISSLSLLKFKSSVADISLITVRCDNAASPSPGGGVSGNVLSGSLSLCIISAAACPSFRQYSVVSSPRTSFSHRLLHFCMVVCSTKYPKAVRGFHLSWCSRCRCRSRCHCCDVDATCASYFCGCCPGPAPCSLPTSFSTCE